VPPRLRQQPQQLIMGFSRSPAPASPQSKEQTEAELITLQYRAFLDTTVPALGDRTPREAAGEPELRPRLIHLLKDSVRRHDERNLRSGRADDINWLLRELGATEILFDPPPRREPLGDVAEDDEDDLPGALPGLPDPPPLPDEPFDFHEAIRRFGIGVDAFDNACEAFEELAACGSTLLADVRVLVDDLLDEFEFSLAALLLARVAFAFAPPGTRQPALNFDRMAETFEGGFEELQRIMPSQNPDSFVQFLEQGAQPALMKLLIAQVLRLGADGPKKVRPSALTQTVMLVLLRAVVDELDRAMREQAAAA